MARPERLETPREDPCCAWSLLIHGPMRPTHARCIDSHLLGMHVCVIGVRFSCSPTSQRHMCCISESTLKRKQKLDGKMDFSLVSYGHWKCMLVDSLSENVGFLIYVSY